MKTLASPGQAFIGEDSRSFQQVNTVRFVDTKSVSRGLLQLAAGDCLLVIAIEGIAKQDQIS
jgi:hypothetical protein